MFSFTRATLSAGLVLSALSITASGFAQTLRESSGVQAGPVVSNGIDNNALNGTYTYAATGGYALGQIRFSGSFEAVGGTVDSYRSEARLRLTAPNGSTFSTSAAFPGFATSPGTATLTDFPIFASNFAGLTSANIAGNWTARFFESVDDNPAATPENDIDGNWTNFKFDFFDGPSSPPGPTSTSLGTINYNGTAQNIDLATGAFAAGEVKWYSFNLARDVSNSTGRFLDLITDVTGITGGGADSEIGLYNSLGNLVGTDDDDGTGNYSALSYGQTTPTRPITGGVAGNGRDGSLTAGTYYLAVVGFNATFSNNFTVTTTSTAASNGYNLRLRAAPAPSSVAVMALGGLMPLVAIARRRRAAK